MICDVSYPDNQIKRAINELVGPPLSFFQKLQQKGAGSPRLIMEKVSEDVYMKLPTQSALMFASIELRPKGIIVYFKKYTEHFVWVVPYFLLSIYQSNGLSIYGGKTFVKFKNIENRHHKFIAKMVAAKAKFSNNHDLPY